MIKSVTKRVLSPNDVFAVDLVDGYLSIGIIRALSEASYGLVMASFSEPFLLLATRELKEFLSNPPATPHWMIFGDQNLQNGKWKVIGNSPGYHDLAKPLPLFGVSIPQVGIRNQLTYSEDLRILDLRSRSKDDHRELPRGGVAGTAYVESFLQRRINASAPEVSAGSTVSDLVKGKAVSTWRLLDEDVVADFLEDVLGASEAPWQVLKETFARCEVADYIPVDLGFEVMASASVIASIIDGRPFEKDLSDRACLAFASIAKDMAASLSTSARKAIQRLKTDSSELMSVWVHESDKNEFIEQVTYLSQRLSF